MHHLKHRSPITLAVVIALIVNLFFWTLLSLGCLFSPVDCLEIFTFTPVFFYTPISWAFTSLPILPASTPFWVTVVLLGLVGLIQHLLLAGLIGWLIGKAINKRKPVQ